MCLRFSVFISKKYALVNSCILSVYLSVCALYFRYFSTYNLKILDSERKYLGANITAGF
jgi:hypothetical protein